MPKDFPEIGKFPHGRFGRAGPLSSPGKQASDPRKEVKAPKSSDIPTEEELQKGSDIRPKALRGGVEDTRRVRLIKNYYSQVIDQQGITFIDWNTQDFYNTNLDREYLLDAFSVGEARFLYIDHVEFYATSLLTGAFVAPGQIEGFVQFIFKIGNKVPLDIRVRKLNITPVTGSYFPFVNDRVGPTETKFNLIARSGEEVKASYTTIAPSPVPLSIVGVRIRGWIGDDIIIKEILEQQK